MATQWLFNPKTSAELTTYTGLDRELVINSDTRDVHVMDGVTPGGVIIGLPREEWNQNGFENRTDSATSFVDATRTFSIEPTGDTYDTWEGGVKYTHAATKTVVIDDTEGVHVIYFDAGVLTAITNPTTSQISDIILNHCIIAVLYWDTSAAVQIYFGEERHGKVMSPVTHAYLHLVNGLQWLRGLAITDILADEDGSSNTHVQFGVEAGAVADEDIFLDISAVAAATGLPLYYKTGTADWNKEVTAGFSIRTSGGTSATRLAFNEFTGGAWQLSEAPEGYYVAYHIFGTTEKTKPMICIMGENAYATEISARRGVYDEIKTLILEGTLSPETRPIGSVLFQTSSAYTNDYNARIVTTDTGDDYYDWRYAEVGRQNGLEINQTLSGVAAYVSTPAATTLTTQNTWYALAGTFTNQILENFTLTAGPPPGIVYGALATEYFKVNYSGSVAGDLNNMEIEIGIAVNGTTPGTETIMGTKLAVSGDNYNVAGVCVLRIETTDVVTIVARCTSHAGRTLTANYFTTTLSPFFG